MTPKQRRRAFEQHQAEQRQRWRRLSEAERLDWLWQAKLFAACAQAAARATDGEPHRPESDQPSSAQVEPLHAEAHQPEPTADERSRSR